jgi:hypothetical protein
MSPRRTARHDDGTADPLVTLARADPLSPFYDPRYARPLSSTPPDGWGEIDLALLEETRAAVPAFPIDLLPPFWRDWILDTANATGAPADYVAQSLFAAVAGLCGAGAVVRLGPRWDEPLVLWQVLVGPPSSGKSPAMAPMRELLAALDAEQADDDEPRSVVTEASLSVVADAVTANPRGVVLWRDDPPTWLRSDAVRAPWLPAWSARSVSFGQGAAGKGARRIDCFAVSLLLACQPHHLSDMLAEDGEFASRLLFAWPDPPSHCPLTLCKPARDDEALAALRRIAGAAGTPDGPLVLGVDPCGLSAFDGFLSAQRAELLRAEDLEMAWLGKGRGTVARLAGVLELLAWSAPGSSVLPGPIGGAPIERAVRLWSDYFRPQALALFHHSVPGERERLARRVARWLRSRGLTEVSREQVRSEALSRSVDAAEADQVMYRLQDAGLLQRALYTGPLRGRPPNRWWVNPRLTTTLSAGNTGNAGKS